MTITPQQPATAEPGEVLGLSPAQLTFFDTFGFLLLRGLFAESVDRIDRGFEEAFRQGTVFDLNEPLHFDEPRRILPHALHHSDDLRWLEDDARVDAIVTSVLGPEYETIGGDASLFYCDTSWHPDTYGAPLKIRHVKLSLYLDPLRGDTGAIRMLPGTNFFGSPYSQAVRRGTDDAASVEQVFGVAPDELPAYVLETEPGDCVVWDYRTIHASFGGKNRRRLLSLNFREPAEAT